MVDAWVRSVTGRQRLLHGRCGDRNETAHGGRQIVVVTSWDDGHPSDQRIGELLAKHRLQGTFFVPLENRENRPVIAKDDLRALASHFEIAAHTRTHRYLTSSLSDADLIAEVSEAKRILEDTLGNAIHGFCYPGGVVNRRAVRTVRGAGFKYARTTENLRFDIGEDRWRLPTTLQFFPHSVNVLARNTLRFPKLSKVRYVTQRMFTADFGAYCKYVAEQCAHADGIFHLWGHSWEIDQHNLWVDLDAFLGTLGRMASTSMPLSKIADAPR